MLFDFDGPLCDVFSGLPAKTIARRLEPLIGQHVDTDDPLEILRYSESLDNKTVITVEHALIAAELEAVNIADPTPGGQESLRTCHDAGLKVGVVSNNSKEAVLAFLQRVNLDAITHPVIGRTFAKPTLMKPHPWPLELALSKLQIPPHEALFVGDSLTDIEVSQYVGVPCIAYADKPGKRTDFSKTTATILDSMWELKVAMEFSHHR